MIRLSARRCGWRDDDNEACPIDRRAKCAWSRSVAHRQVRLIRATRTMIVPVLRLPGIARWNRNGRTVYCGRGKLNRHRVSNGRSGRCECYRRTSGSVCERSHGRGRRCSRNLVDHRPVRACQVACKRKRRTFSTVRNFPIRYFRTRSKRCAWR